MSDKHLLAAVLLFSLLSSLPAWADSAAQRILLKAEDTTVTEQDLEQELLLLPEAERTRTLATLDQMKALLRQIYQGKKFMAEAERLDLEQTPLGQARLMAARRQALSELLRDHVRERIEVPDFEALARENYASDQDKFQLPERFKAAHILKSVRCDCERDQQRQRIEQLRARLQAGEDFMTLAKTESDDTATASKGGDLGDWFDPGQLAAPFAEALVKPNPGQLSDIVETQFGFHIIKLLDRQPARLQSFGEVRSSIEQRLRQTYVQEQLSKRAKGYLPGPDAKYDEPALEALSSKR